MSWIPLTFGISRSNGRRLAGGPKRFLVRRFLKRSGSITSEIVSPSILMCPSRRPIDWSDPIVKDRSGTMPYNSIRSWARKSCWYQIGCVRGSA